MGQKEMGNLLETPYPPAGRDEINKCTSLLSSLTICLPPISGTGTHTGQPPSQKGGRLSEITPRFFFPSHYLLLFYLNNTRHNYLLLIYMFIVCPGPQFLLQCKYLEGKVGCLCYVCVCFRLCVPSAWPSA